jgi:hypothetical protein
LIRLTCVVPAQDTLAVPAAARAPAAAGDGLTRGRRGPTSRHGPGRAARPTRREIAVVGSTGLTTDDPDGTPAHGRAQHRRAVEANPLQAVGGRPWPGRDDGPAGQTVCLTHASVPPPGPPCDEDDERRLIAHGGLTEATPPWELGPPPQQTDGAVRVQVLCTLRRCALATADRRPGAHATSAGAAPVGWQRWRRVLLEPTRNQGIGCAQGSSGLCQVAESSRRLGENRTDRPPGSGTRQPILAQYRLTADG